MKIIFTIAFILFSITCNSEEIDLELYMPNESGNFTVLTEERCEIDRFKETLVFKMYSEDEAMNKHYGCWNLTEPDPRNMFEQLIIIQYDEVVDSVKFTFRKKLFSNERKR